MAPQVLQSMNADEMMEVILGGGAGGNSTRHICAESGDKK